MCSLRSACSCNAVSSAFNGSSFGSASSRLTTSRVTETRSRPCQRRRRAMHDPASFRTRPPVPIGNAYDKYGSTNPVVRRLMRGFTAGLDDLLELAAPQSILDVGCGEGVLTEQWAGRFERVVGVDLDHPTLRREWEGRRRPNLEFLAGDAGSLPFAADEFDLVCGVEVLEHLP